MCQNTIDERIGKFIRELENYFGFGTPISISIQADPIKSTLVVKHREKALIERSIKESRKTYSRSWTMVEDLALKEAYDIIQFTLKYGGQTGEKMLTRKRELNLIENLFYSLSFPFGLALRSRSHIGRNFKALKSKNFK